MAAMRNYRREWDKLRGVWKDRPRHDDNSHGADGLMTFAIGWQVPVKVRLPKRRHGTGWAS